MNAKLVTLGSAAALAVLSLFVLADDEREWFVRGPDVEAVVNPDYEAECGACHFAYQPGLLPARSWEALMAGLDEHFGDNAELDSALAGRITAYLTGHAADASEAPLSKRIIRSLGASGTPLRISGLPTIAREHNELPARLHRNNPDVGSLSNCPACHRRAADGIYNEHTVNVPGYGEWDD